MRLVLLRHAEAEEKGTRSDKARRLTEQGRSEAVRIGLRLAKEGIRPDAIVSSPATRALETAVLASPGLGYEIGEIVSDDAMYEGSPQQLLQVAAKHGKGRACVVLVGHNPGLRELGLLLDSLQESWSLPKGHAAMFESNGEEVGAGAFRHLADVTPSPE